MAYPIIYFSEDQKRLAVYQLVLQQFNPDMQEYEAIAITDNHGAAEAYLAGAGVSHHEDVQRILCLEASDQPEVGPDEVEEPA